MKDFMQMQVDVSERLYKMMLDDHKERIEDMKLWADTSVSLMRKLDARDREIEKLRAEITALKAGNAL
jgi:predicted translin family RNA/ssDNA-binding protein